ncbi:SDR family oxidoreductase [Novosphingobium resinovorum]|jgi:3-oxoacyl-[acyl-carrier protein] reductase|uniref:Oxidoreductase n=1 Tax=Novosphingobium resinovorum TaxID=158500 RepID=A0A1D8AEG8_9SPHN|nr:SDR family oxidoreductase [Novosphingobium resinovorum]AOR80490.1 oxidoreductase [Novosphingobium resinovorum]
MPQLTLAGKVALVTGGSRGIGAAIVRRLASEGAHVAFSYASSPGAAEQVERACIEAGGTAKAFRADQGDAAQAETFARVAGDHFGGVDILVNSAGIYAPGSFDEPDFDLAAFDRMMLVNVQGVVRTVLGVAPMLRDGGRIITVGTSGVHMGRFVGSAGYVGAKSALTGFTRGWARDFGPRGITANIIQPGPIDTDMNPEGTRFSARLIRTTCLERYGKVEEVAGVVSFLAGPDAGYVTGVSLLVDGGQCA